MGKSPAGSVADDFVGVVALFKQRNIIPAVPPAHLVDNARKIHRATYSLITWRFRLKQTAGHRRVFLEEIASDALQVLPQALMGYGKTTKLLTRGIIENGMRHLYFSDHPIEFERMNRDAKWYVKTDDLFTYALNHPNFLDTEKEFDAINRLSSLYSEVSAGIHGRRVSDLETRIALSKIRYSKKSIVDEAAFIQRCAESANFLLAVFHREQLRHFGQEDQSIILRSMCKRARRAWTDTH